MERNIQRSGLINLLALLAVGVAGFAVARFSHSLAGQISVFFIGLGVLVAAVSWFQMRLEQSERLERLELDELAKGPSGSALFEAKDSELLPVRHSREQFERYFVPIFTVLLCLLQAGGAYGLWRWLPKPNSVPALVQPTTGLTFFGLFALVLFLLGKFSATIARLGQHRLLRPGASFLLLGAYLCSVVTLGLIGVQTSSGRAPLVRADFYVAHALCILLALITIETLINLVLELYRPRVKGKSGRPLYESRLVGLLGQPEGLVTTAAQALDYQFGFQVSETWFYRFFRRALLWLLLLQGGVLALSTCVVFIEAGEQGLLERWGKPVAQRTVLEPGVHFKWPWPMDQVYRFRTEQIQSFELGTASDAEVESETVVLWTVAHNKEDNLLVANRETLVQAGPGEQPANKRTPPVSLITGSIPVQFQITNLMSWAYKNEDAASLLKDLASREVVRFFVSADMNEVMSYGRLEASQQLARFIQKAADERGLGAKIVSVGLHDMHPPVKVAPDYEKVVGAIQTKQARILVARAEQIRTNTMAAAQAISLTNAAYAARKAHTVGALAQAALFTNQIPAFQAAPSVYAQRAYLQAFVRATATARKYVWLTTNTHDVLTFDLQDQVRDDLINLKVGSPKK